MKAIQQLLCWPHDYRHTERGEPTTIEQAIVNLYNTYVKCEKCGHEGWLDSHLYVVNLTQNNRLTNPSRRDREEAANPFNRIVARPGVV